MQVKYGHGTKIKYLGSRQWISDLRAACGVNIIDGVGIESVYERGGMCGKGEGMNYGVLEVVKVSTLKWYGHLEKIGRNDVIKRYKTGVDALGMRGKALLYNGRIEYGNI